MDCSDCLVLQACSPPPPPYNGTGTLVHAMRLCVVCRAQVARKEQSPPGTHSNRFFSGCHTGSSEVLGCWLSNLVRMPASCMNAFSEGALVEEEKQRRAAVMCACVLCTPSTTHTSQRFSSPAPDHSRSQCV